MAGKSTAEALRAFLHFLAEYAPVFSREDFVLALELARRLHKRLSPRESGGDEEADLSVIQSLFD